MTSLHVPVPGPLATADTKKSNEPDVPTAKAASGVEKPSLRRSKRHQTSRSAVKVNAEADPESVDTLSSEIVLPSQEAPSQDQATESQQHDQDHVSKVGTKSAAAKADDVAAEEEEETETKDVPRNGTAIGKGKGRKGLDTWKRSKAGRKDHVDATEKRKAFNALQRRRALNRAPRDQ